MKGGRRDGDSIGVRVGARNSSNIGTKGGYESEGENRSMNSTTTSSTMQFMGRNNSNQIANDSQ